MNDLPSYPTPRQAAYVVPPAGSHQPSSGRKKPASSNVSYKPPPPQSSSYGNNNYQQIQPQLSGSHPQQHPSRQQPVQQVHFHQQPPQAPQSSYYQQPQAAPPHQAYSNPGRPVAAPQEQYYSPPNTLASAPTPQQAYYQSQPPPPPPQQYQQPPAQQQHHQHHPSGHGYQSAPMSSSQSSGSHQQRYESAPSKKPPPSVGGNYQGSRSKESFHEPVPPPKQSSKQKLESELRAVFDKVDVNKSGRISKTELSNALLNFDHTRFQDSTISLMINLFTSPNSGAKHLNFDQFVSLWKYLSAYKKLFVQADSNNSGDISFGEFQKVLEQIGYKLNIDLVLHLFQKFSYKDPSNLDSTAVGKLKFDKFIELLVYLRKLTDIFKKYDKDLSGVATINFSDFLFEVSNLN